MHCARDCVTELCYRIAANCTVQASVEQNCVRVLQKTALSKTQWNRTVLQYCSKLHCASDCGTELCYSIAENCTVQATVEQNCVTVLQEIALCKQVWNRTMLEYCSKFHCANKCGTELCYTVAANCTVQASVEHKSVQYCSKLHCARDCGTELCYSIAANSTVQETV